MARLLLCVVAFLGVTHALPAYSSCLQKFCASELATCSNDAVCSPVLKTCLSEGALYDVFSYEATNITGNKAITSVLTCGQRALCHDAESPSATLAAQCVADHCLDAARACSQSDTCEASWKCSKACGLGLKCVEGCTSANNTLSKALMQCTQQQCADPAKPVGEGAECCPCEAQHRDEQCTAKDIKCRRPAPPCKAPLKCYSSSLIDSGSCMANKFAEKGEPCCIFCKTAPPCDTGMKCYGADPYSEGTCTAPWEVNTMATNSEAVSNGTSTDDWKPCHDDSDCSKDDKMCCVASPMAPGLARCCTKGNCKATFNPYTGQVNVCKDK